jgi:PAS domain S-box-containing protein
LTDETGGNGGGINNGAGFNRYLEVILETIPDAIAVVSTEGFPLQWNRLFKALVGCTDDEIESTVAAELLSSEDAPALIEVFREVLSTGEDRFAEARVRHKDGSLTPCIISGSVLRNEAGEPVGVLGVARDVAVIKEAQEELQKERVFVETILENVPEAVVVYDGAGRPLRWNEAFRALVRYGDEEIAGLNMLDFHAAEVQEYVKEAFESVVHDGESFEIEATVRAKGGEEIICNLGAAPLADASGKVIGVIGVGLDMTGWKRQEKALLEERDFVDTVLEALADAFVVYDLEGNPLRWNSAYRELVGYSDEEIKERKAWDFHPPQEVGYVAAEFGEVIATGKRRFIETGALNKNGERIPCMLSGAVIKDAEGTPVGLVGIGRDISEKKRQEEELERHRERLEDLVRLRTAEYEDANLQLRSRVAEVERAREELVRLNRELEGYAHTVSHELRNPLSGIYLAVEWLERLPVEEDCGRLKEEIGRLAGQVKANVTRAEMHIKGLLSLAEAGQRPVRVVPVDINGTVESIAGEISPLLEAKGAEVEVEGDLGSLSANPTQMYQLFSNLIYNAVKHNDSEGLRVTVHRLEEAGGVKRYLVRDNGAGLDPLEMEELFKPFARGAEGRTGLGLAIVAKIVNVHGGEIRAYNDGGACFDFTLKGFPGAEYGG